MGVFFLLLLVPVMFQHFTIGGSWFSYENRNKIALNFFFLFLTILVMFRHKSVGTDTENYIYFFKRLSGMTWNEVGAYGLENGFSYFNKIISLISEKPHFFLAIVAVVASVMIYPTYKRLCTDASLTIVLFCIMSTFVMMFSGLRQMMAIGLGFVAYEFTRKNKIIPFICIVLLAITFHKSAFMVAFMYPLYHAKITKKWLYAVVPLLAIVFVFNQQFFSVLTLILTKYIDYDASVTQTGAYTMLILFVVFAIFAFLIPEETLLDRETIGLRNFLLLSVVLQMFAPLHTIAMRMNYYYIIFIPLLIPKIIKCRSKRWGRVAIVGRNVMVIFFLIYFFANAYTGGNLNVFPYHFFWENI